VCSRPISGIRIGATGLSTYPDGAVVCGRTARAADDPIAVINPVLLVEVTSPSTEHYDRGEKLRHYRQLPSLQEVLIVSHREPRVTLVAREQDQWTSDDYRAGQSVPLRTLGRSVAVDDLYRGGLEDV
jgi:Uma2 family endonuclease